MIPPSTSGRDRRAKRLMFAAVAAVVVVLAVAVLFITDYLNKRGERCAGLDATTGDGYALSLVDGQCVGWIVEHDYAFGGADPAIQSIITRITAENRRVRDLPDRTSSVRVGVMMPMTSKPDSAMSSTEVRTALEGAYAAQIYANNGLRTELGDPVPLVQLVLANNGLQQDLWPSVVPQLVGLRGGDHPLVAVTGLGVSKPATRDVADALGAQRIPTVGAVVTANDMTAKDFFKVSPSNHDFALALQKFLAPQANLGAGYLVYDRNNEDSYVRTLKESLLDVFGDSFGLENHSRGFTGTLPSKEGTPLLFSEHVRDVCALHPGVIFYAGRDRDLDDLITALKTRGTCQADVRPLLIATTATGFTIPPELLDDAKVALVNAATTDNAAWAGDTSLTSYQTFRQLFTTKLGLPEQDLDSGYAIMHRDAVAAVVWAVRRDVVGKVALNQNRGSAPSIPEISTPEDVRNHLFGLPEQSFPGAAGSVYFRENPPNELRPAGKPVPIILVGAHSATLRRVPTYVTGQEAE
ncbi:MAG: hypothetical protein ACRDSR_00790 [Pseudonocardiaceae bacterium]